MFLSVGDKLKKYRKKFNIKLNIFENYGYSCAYISYIENNKRIPPKETARQIYYSLEIITNQEIKKHISLENFILSESEEALKWVNDKCNIKYGLENYTKYLYVCKKYKLNKFILKMDDILAYYYQSLKDYGKSNEYFINCIVNAEVDDNSHCRYYIELAVNYQDLGRYEESILNLKIALKSPSKIYAFYKHRIYYELSRNYYYLSNIELSYFYLDKIPSDCEEEIKASAFLLRENILKSQGKLVEGEEILREFISQPSYPKYLKYAYHNLGSNLNDQKRYGEAIEVLKKAISYRDSALEVALTNSLLGEVYYRMKNFKLSMRYYDELKETILIKGTLRQKEVIVERLIELYFKEQELKRIENLITMLNNYKNAPGYRDLENLLKMNILKQRIIHSGLDLPNVVEEYIS